MGDGGSTSEREGDKKTMLMGIMREKEWKKQKMTKNLTHDL